MGKQFSSPMLDQLNTAVDTLTTTVNTLKNTDVSNVSAKVSKLTEEGQVPTSSFVASHQANTILNISGAGVLMGVTASTTSTYSIQVDGGTIFQFGLPAAGTVGLNIRFNASCLVKCSTAAGSGYNAFYRLD